MFDVQKQHLHSQLEALVGVQPQFWVPQSSALVRNYLIEMENLCEWDGMPAAMLALLLGSGAALGLVRILYLLELHRWQAGPANAWKRDLRQRAPNTPFADCRRIGLGFGHHRERIIGEQLEALVFRCSQSAGSHARRWTTST